MPCNEKNGRRKKAQKLIIITKQDIFDVYQTVSDTSTLTKFILIKLTTLRQTLIKPAGLSHENWFITTWGYTILLIEKAQSVSLTLYYQFALNKIRNLSKMSYVVNEMNFYLVCRWCF